jgi:4-hydroxy-3-methylbut-2-enyl diphosphate reductase
VKWILLANPRGFCAGVDRAISIVETLTLYGAPIYVRHDGATAMWSVASRSAAPFLSNRLAKCLMARSDFLAHGVSQAARNDEKPRSDGL